MNGPARGRAGEHPPDQRAGRAAELSSGGTAAPTTGGDAGPSRVFRRVLLGIAGVALIGFLIYGAGPARVAQVLWQTRPWIPLIVALELSQLLADFASLRFILGDAARGRSRRRPTGDAASPFGEPRVPPSAWVRSSAMAYALMILVPAGRAAGEVARATILSKHVGAGPAARASVELQSGYAFAIGVLSALECAVVASRIGLRSPLALLLCANALVTIAFSAGLVALLWNVHLGQRLERLLQRVSRSSGQSAPPAPPGERERRLPWVPAAFCVASRSMQVIQYGVILRAVGGQTSAVRALVLHGTHLVAATVGDILPNGLGIVDATYRAFASQIGFADAPARALSIAFVAHLAQLLLATACLIVVALTRPSPARTNGR